MFWQSRVYWGREIRLAGPDRDFFARLDQLIPRPPGHDSEPETCLGEGQGGDVAILLKPEGPNFSLYRDSERIASTGDWLGLLEPFEGAFQLELSSKAPEAVFIHAGVVTLGERVLILPATTFSGKSTLVHALVELGANYFSDEFAIIDHEGWVYPYRRAVTLRQSNGTNLRIHPDRFDLSEVPRGRVSLIFDCRYEEGADWNPQPLTGGEGLLALFRNCVSAQLTPQRDLAWLKAAVQEARSYRAVRGDVQLAAPRLLELLSGG